MAKFIHHVDKVIGYWTVVPWQAFYQDTDFVSAIHSNIKFSSLFSVSPISRNGTNAIWLVFPIKYYLPINERTSIYFYNMLRLGMGNEDITAFLSCASIPSFIPFYYCVKNKLRTKYRYLYSTKTSLLNLYLKRCQYFEPEHSSVSQPIHFI